METENSYSKVTKVIQSIVRMKQKSSTSETNKMKQEAANFKISISSKRVNNFQFNNILVNCSKF